MRQLSSYGMRVLPVARAGAQMGEYALPALTTVCTVMRAGGILGAVTGFVSAGVKCVRMKQSATITAGEAVRIFGRDVTTGIASGVAASAAGLYVSAAAATIGAVISAPAWVPGSVAVAAAIGVGYVVTEGCHGVWDRCST